MPLTRKLQFKDRFVYHLTRQIDGDCEGEPILFPDDETPIKFVVEMSQNQFTELLSALMTGADLSYPEKSHEVVWNLLKQVECPVSICEEILECLQPAFDEINGKLDDIEEKVDIIDEKIDGNIAKPPPEVIESVDTRICGGAAGALAYLNTIILKTYAESESGFFDNVTESVAAIISALPILGQLPFDELILLANAYFANQQTEYESDYVAGYNAILFDLYCKLLATSGVFSAEVYNDWLTGLQDRVPANRASYIFSRFAPAYQTFINQIAEFIFGEDSFEQFFSELYLYYLSGAETPSFLCAGADCGNWRHTLRETDIPDHLTFESIGEFDGAVIVSETYNPFGADVTGMQILVEFDTDTDLTEIVIHQSAGVFIEGSTTVNRFITVYDALDAILYTEVLPQQDGDWEVVIDDLIEGVRKVIIQYVFFGNLQAIAWDEVTFAGISPNPFE